MTLLEQIQKTTQSWMVEKNPRTNILKTVWGVTKITIKKPDGCRGDFRINQND